MYYIIGLTNVKSFKLHFCFIVTKIFFIAKTFHHTLNLTEFTMKQIELYFDWIYLDFSFWATFYFCLNFACNIFHNVLYKEDL